MNPRNVLFIAEGQLGDLLLLTPALRAMKTTFTSARISLLVFDRRGRPPTRSNLAPAEIIGDRATSGASSALVKDPNVDEIFTINRAALGKLHGLAKAKAEFTILRFVRRKKFDTVICTWPEDRFTICAFASGAKARVGQEGQALDWLLTLKVNTRVGSRGVLEYYCDLVRALGAAVTSNRTEFIIPESSRRWADEFLRSCGLDRSQKLIAIHPDATGDYKIWPPERYAALVDKLQTDANVRVILFRGVEDEHAVNDIRRVVRTKLTEADPGHDIENFAALLQRCALCVSNDSGPRHLAAAIGTPSLAFLRQFHDRQWKVYPEDDDHATLQGKEKCPVCPPNTCLDKVPNGERFGSYCLRMISVDEAFTRISEILSSSGRSHPSR
ncbi:MAG: glycosyltransferase family 9 protein [Bacteroidota bacterium]